MTPRRKTVLFRCQHRACWWPGAVRSWCPCCGPRVYHTRLALEGRLTAGFLREKELLSSVAGGRFKYRIKRLITRSRKISTAREWWLKLFKRFDIWQASLLLNFKAIWTLSHPISRVRHFARSHEILKRSPGLPSISSTVTTKIAAEKSHISWVTITKALMTSCHGNKI